jgi:hypothetical protein
MKPFKLINYRTTKFTSKTKDILEIILLEDEVSTVPITIDTDLALKIVENYIKPKFTKKKGVIAAVNLVFRKNRAEFNEKLVIIRKLRAALKEKIINEQIISVEKEHLNNISKTLNLQNNVLQIQNSSQEILIKNNDASKSLTEDIELHFEEQIQGIREENLNIPKQNTENYK